MIILAADGKIGSKTGATISFTLAIADDGTILFKDEYRSGNKEDKESPLEDF